MADILKIVFIILGILIVYVSYWLLAQALFPQLVESANRHYGRPVRITFLGLLTALPPVVLGIILSKMANPLLKFIGVTLLILPGLLGLIGSAGLTFRIGVGLPSPTDPAQPWRRVLRGGIVLAFTFLLPIVGWIILPLWVLVSGLGAFILAVREQKKVLAEAAPEAPSAMVPAR
jgi:hypothetical protein